MRLLGPLVDRVARTESSVQTKLLAGFVVVSGLVLATALLGPASLSRMGLEDGRPAALAVLIGLAVVGLVAALLVGLVVTSSVALPLRHMNGALARIAQGDLDTRVSVPNRDEIGTLGQHLNATVEELARLHGECTRLSGELRERSSQLAAAREVAHRSREVRAPLSAIINYAELTAAGVADDGQVAVLPDLEHLEAVARHLLGLIDAVTAESAAAGVSTVTMSLPAAPTNGASVIDAVSTPVEPSATPPALLDPNAPTVLVVQHGERVSAALNGMLAAESFQVMAASSVDGGNRRARDVRPTAILLDALLPGFDAWRILAALKSDRRLAATPVILAAVADEGSLTYALPANDVLLSPADPVALDTLLWRLGLDGAPGRALVVDAEDRTRETSERLLADAGWTVSTAQDGWQAMASADEARPDLVLLDPHLTVMDGLAFLHELRAVEAWRAIPVALTILRTMSPEDGVQLGALIRATVARRAASQEDVLETLRRLLRVGATRRNGAARGRAAPRLAAL
jgi:DNA-binding response OmpR family regulator/HAMP domain-containing protein